MSNNFRKARELNRLTQEEVAKKLGVSRTAYVRYENGERECSFETLRNLANILSVTIDYLLGRENKANSLSEAQSALLSNFNMLNGEGQNTIMNVLDGLKLSHAKKVQKMSSLVQNNKIKNNYGAVGNFSASVTIG